MEIDAKGRVFPVVVVVGGAERDLRFILEGLLVADKMFMSWSAS